MKRLIVAATVFLLILTLCACTGAQSTSSLPEASESPAVSEAVSEPADVPESEAQAPALDTTGWTAEDYTAYRTTIPYTPLIPSDYSESTADYRDRWARERTYPGYVDAETISLYGFLNIWGYMDREIASATDFTAEEVAARICIAAHPIYAYPDTHGYDAEAAELAKPLVASAAATGENKFISGTECTILLKEQVEQAAKFFFGEDYQMAHCSAGIWIYHPLQGIYTVIPTDYSGFNGGYPLINNYSYHSDGTVEVLLSYTSPMYSMGEGEMPLVKYDRDTGEPLTGTYADNLTNGIPAWRRDNIAAHKDGNATWHKIVLMYDNQSHAFTFVSHSYDTAALEDFLFSSRGNPD